MLKTLYTIGQEVSEGRDLWEDIIESKVESPKEGFKHYVLNLIFDLDTKEIILSKDNLKELDDSFESLKSLMLLKTLGRNMKSPYLCVDSKKIQNLSKAIFGKPDKDGVYPGKGDLAQSIENDFPELLQSEIANLLPQIFEFREAFEMIFKKEKGKLTIEKVNEALELNKKNKIILLYASVKSTELNVKNKAVSDFEGYKDYLLSKFLDNNEGGGNTKTLCYATGEIRDDIQETNFSGRYNINKLFVKETKNYAPNFNSKDFHKSYQVSGEIQSFLDRGSDYILNNLVTTIADVRHVVIPQFLNSKKIVRKSLEGILSNTDLLFNSRRFETLESYFQRKGTDGAYWLNFMAIDSDGNYFKAGNAIKDVSKFHFSALIKSLMESGDLFAPWLGRKFAFNLNRMYRFIPVRKDKENVNQALKLFACILEGRKVELRNLYRHFTELALCHWHSRYVSFPNVNKFNSDFDYAAKDAVFGYLAFINTLRQLNLLKNEPPMDDKKITGSIAEEISDFFAAMNYQPAQCSLFYLGRALNQAAYAQKQKGNKKAVLEKVNYNGMDKRSIYRLSTDLFEKGKQYDILEKIQWNLAEFNRGFDFNKWDMNPQEALFFILSGYTYGIKSNAEPESNNE